MRKITFMVWLLGGLILLGCEAARPAATEQAAVTPTATVVAATPTPVKLAATCADIDANWGNDWAAVVDTLEELIAAGQSCGEEPLLSKKYAVHFNYGASLEGNGEVEAAVEQYQAALFIDPQRKEALDALIRLEALPKPTPPACLSTSPPRPDPVPAEEPDPDLFVTVQGDELQLAGQPFPVKGVNYYPRQAPWRSFLAEADPAEMAKELDLIRQAGFNTLRIFLWYTPLFTCQPEDAIPNEEVFALVGSLFQLARERDLKVIVTLNDLADLVFRPLYTDWDHYDAQTVYIVRRYRNEPAILAWDVRNAGDDDYGQEGDRFSQEEVLDWLAHVSDLIRENDPYHLLTASWVGDPAKTAPYVDFLSFQHWAEAESLQERLAGSQKEALDQPLLLAASGFHSWAESPDEPRTEAEQAERLIEIVELAEAENLAGWMIWTAFDFVPAPGWPPTKDHFFGLWRTDLTPKPVLEALPLPP